MPHFLKKAHLVAPFFYLLTQYAYATNPLETHYQFSEFLYSPAMPVNNISNWDGELKADNFAHGHSKLKAGFQWERWQFGVIKRRDFWATFSSDAAELYNQLQTEGEPPVGRTYQIKLNSQDLQSNGFFLRYDLVSHSNFSLSLSAHYLSVSDYEFGAYNGEAQRIAISADDPINKQYRLDVPLEIYHQGSNCLVGSKICLPPAETSRESSIGLGYSLDIEAAFMWPWIQGSIEISDLASEIKWDGLMHTNGKLIPFTAINEFTPGQDAHSYESFKMTFPVKAIADIALPVQRNLSVLSRYYYIQGIDNVPEYTETSLGIRLYNDDIKFTFLHGFRLGKKELSLTYRCLAGSIGFDDWELSLSRNISLGLGIKLTDQGCTP